jgi:hypothetical protein
MALLSLFVCAELPFMHSVTFAVTLSPSDCSLDRSSLLNRPLTIHFYFFALLLPLGPLPSLCRVHSPAHGSPVWVFARVLFCLS